MSIMSWKVFTQSLKYKILPYTVQFINSVIQLHSCIICDVRLVYKLIAFWGAAQPFRSLLNVLDTLAWRSREYVYSQHQEEKNRSCEQRGKI